MIVILTTIHKKKDAAEIGMGLLEKRLIVCYNLIPIESAYWWEGKILEENESLLLMKSKDDNFEKVEKYIKKTSGYDVPEVICLSPKQVNKSYLNWVNTETK